MSTTTSKTERPGWDKRAWILAAILCGVLGILTLAGTLGPDSLHPDGGVLESLIFITALLASFAFPPILSGIARRRTLLWAYLPLVAWIAWVLAAFTIDAMGGWIDNSTGASDSSSGTNDELFAIVFLLVGPLITAGPVCVIRYAIRRKSLRSQARAAAMEQAIRAPREGVWPPPPNSGGPGP